MSVEVMQKESDAIKESIVKKREEACDTSLPEAAESIDPVDVKFKCRRTLKGHTGKIYSMAWCNDSERVLSAAQDGKLIIWSAYDGEKMGVACLRSNWVMASAFSPSGLFVASGGLDNICSVWSAEKMDAPVKELAGHAGFLSSCKFVDDKQILTSSGDTKIALWDIEQGKKILEYSGHSGDVTSIALLPSRSGIVSCSVDGSVKVWDLREPECKQSMTGHEGDINNIAVFPSGDAVATAGDDGTCRLFDLRADQQISQFGDPEPDATVGASSVAFSCSGRLLFAGYYDNTVQVWDTLRGEHVYELLGHEQRVQSIGVSANGMALCSASWDGTLRVWN